MDRSSLLTEGRNPASNEIDTATALEIVDIINAQDQSVSSAVADERKSIARLIDAVVDRFARGGRLFYVGAGTSGRLGVIDAAECPPTFGTPPGLVTGIIAGGNKAVFASVEGAEDDYESGAAVMADNEIAELDTVVGIAASGSTPFVLGALSSAMTTGAYTALITCIKPTTGKPLADLTISLLVGPEVVTGSTRMKAGTATKMVLNMITTGAMIRMGKTYGNLMVDVMAWCEKLQDRAQRIVMTATGIGRPRATELLDETKGSAKKAIVMALLGIGSSEAGRRLEGAANSSIRKIVGHGPPDGNETAT